MDSPRVLIVEDFEDLRNLVAFFLGARGYQVLEAGNGRAAIQTALNGKPNFILLDLRLPDIDGLEVARELRNSPATEHYRLSDGARIFHQTRSERGSGLRALLIHTETH
jgi:CheY-like chemotaxis protein